MIRQQIGNEEIDFLAETTRGRKSFFVVGEVKTTLAAKDVTQLQRKAGAVKTHYRKCNGHEILPVLIVQHAREKEVENARRKGVMVVQRSEL